MAFKLTNSKETALRAFIEEWIKDPTLYCSSCGDKYIPCPEGCEPFVCCNRMQICTNLVALWGVIQENKILRETRNNSFASNDKKDFRFAMSLPPKLLFDLEEYSINQLKEPLWQDYSEQNDFMKAFPQLCIPERV